MGKARAGRESQNFELDESGRQRGQKRVLKWSNSGGPDTPRGIIKS
jgi:hypothetical protein